MKNLILYALFLLPILPLSAQPGIIIPDPPRILPPNPPVPRPNPGLFELDLRNCKVETTISGLSATTNLEQVFYNPTDFAWQGYYLYPMAGISAIKKFTMFVDGKELEAELLDADKARELYESIVRKFADPAILEYYNYGALKMRIFPVPPRKEVRIRLSYVQSLVSENGLIEYSLPFRQKDIQQKTIGEASFKINIQNEGKIKNIYCPTHRVEINRRDDHTATVGYEQKNIRSENDFKLFIQTDNNKIGASLIAYNDATEDGYFYLDLAPGFATQAQAVDKDITFVVDASGSMAGENMDQAKKALLFCLNNLNAGDRFNIVRFSTEAEELFDGLQPVDAPHLDKAKDYIANMKAIGGTNIEEALQKALQNGQAGTRPYFIVFMTDGRPTIGETGEDLLVKKVSDANKSNTRIFTLGIGTELNTHLLDRLTEMTKAFRTYILPQEDIEIKVSDFYTKVSSPILTDLKLKVDNVNVSDLYPKMLPDLFAGSSLGIYGRYKGSGEGRITLTGKVNGREETYTYNLNFDKNNKKNDFIPTIWATRAVGFLLDQIRLNGENKELKEEIVRLSKKYGIITPYTSYLILEDERQLIGIRPERRQDMILHNKAGQAGQLMTEEAYEVVITGNGGAEGVRSSKEIQDLSRMDNAAQTKVGKERMNYADTDNKTSNLATDMMQVQGRAIYNDQGKWMDANIAVSENSNASVRKIRFNSDEFFKALREQPSQANLLALGKNIRLKVGNEIWEVYE